MMSKVEEILTRLKNHVKEYEKSGGDMDECNWSPFGIEGIIISANEAKLICDYVGVDKKVAPYKIELMDNDIVGRSLSIQTEMHKYVDVCMKNKGVKYQDAANVFLCLKIARLEKTIECLLK